MSLSVADSTLYKCQDTNVTSVLTAMLSASESDAAGRNTGAASEYIMPNAVLGVGQGVPG